LSGKEHTGPSALVAWSAWSSGARAQDISAAPNVPRPRSGFRYFAAMYAERPGHGERPYPFSVAEFEPPVVEFRIKRFREVFSDIRPSLPDIPDERVGLTDRESIRDLAPTAYETLTDGLRRTDNGQVIVSEAVLTTRLYNAEVFQSRCRKS